MFEARSRGRRRGGRKPGVNLPRNFLKEAPQRERKDEGGEETTQHNREGHGGERKGVLKVDRAFPPVMHAVEQM